jgi:hypothetical protein
MNHHEVIWTQPPALTASSTARVLPTPGAAVQQPAILRFDNDAFMQDFLNLLDANPERLAEYKVRRETWRGFVATETPAAPKTPSLVRQRLGILGRRAPAGSAGPGPALLDAPPVPAGTPLKLYQPAHQRHYLVGCSLVCKVPGLPDRGLEAGMGEKATYVIRRLLPPASDPASNVIATWEEHAWVGKTHGFVWQRVGADRLQLVEGEERLPLFAVQFAENERRRRRMFAGVIPCGKRETYLGAPKSAGSTAPGVTARTARKVLLRKEVIEPWKTLVRRALQVEKSFIGPFVGEDRVPTNEEKKARLRIERAQIQMVSWFILLDFAKYLAAHVKPVWRAVLQPTRRAALTDPEQELFDALDDITITDTLRARLSVDAETLPTGNELYRLERVLRSLRAALAEFGAAPDGLNAQLEVDLDAIDTAYNRASAASRALWPDFLFPLADPDLPNDAPLPAATSLGSLTQEEQDEVELDENRPLADDALERIDKLAVLVLRALRDDDPQPAPQPAVPTAAIAPADALIGWFVIRCVYERPACEPLHREVVSEPTEPFQIAGFFDPDAPARPVRIGLPIDTTPAGLRKFDKNTAFVISDTLCGQIQRIKGITLADLVLSVLPWPFHKDLPSLEGEEGPCKTTTDSLGMICSLSIPIVTICALILLIIMVSLFDFIFRWMPYFIFCFPLPGLKAKKK